KNMRLIYCMFIIAGILSIQTIKAQTVLADMVTQNANDKFIYDNEDMPHYAIKWLVDSWQPGGILHG
ncbi:hypothetical protein ACI6Q2_23200, partial [Chitinophagaceae bacterium LWZ2-11]